MTHPSRRSPFVFVAAAALAAVTLAAPRTAAAVDCGVPVTVDTVLDRDLTCPDDGLVVGAHGITIDLGGHTITGPGLYTTAAGVRGLGFEGVTIRNGKLAAFGYGVYLESMRDGVVTGLTIGTTQVAISIRTSERIRVDSNAVDQPSMDGIFVLASTATEVTSNDVSHAPIGVEASDSVGTLVARNRISAPGHGVTVTYGSSATVVAGNVVVAPGSDGFVVISNATGTALVGNSVSRAGGQGFYVQSDASGTTLTANLSTRNGGDGFFVDDPTATLTRNLAFRNAGYGIDADPAVTDGGGNVAAGNGAGQCTGITCTGK